MGFIDSFSSDTPVTVKQPDYFSLMKEAVKAELILNGIKCGVPGGYLAAVATGKIETVFIETENTLECAMEYTEEKEAWGSLTMAIRSIIEQWDNESQVRNIEKCISGILRELIEARVKELQIKQSEEQLAENVKKPKKNLYCNTCFHMRKERPLPICGECEKGSKYATIIEDEELTTESEET